MKNATTTLDTNTSDLLDKAEKAILKIYPRDSAAFREWERIRKKLNSERRLPQNKGDMIMIKENSYWIDNNDNRWKVNFYSEEEAAKLSKSLINCWDCQDCQDCQNCYNCRDCRNCHNCRNCRDCLGFKSNPQKYVTGPIGSRKQQTRFYWTANQSWVVCGCYRDTLEAFEKRVEKVHGDNEYGKQYQKAIGFFRTCMNQGS